MTEKEKGEGGLPRIIRLSRRLKLSEKETLVMIYVLTCQVGEARKSAIRFGRFAGRHQTAIASFPSSVTCHNLIEFKFTVLLKNGMLSDFSLPQLRELYADTKLYNCLLGY